MSDIPFSLPGPARCGPGVIHSLEISVELTRDDDRAQFTMMAGHVRTIAETMLREFFGDCERVDKNDRDVDCPSCQRWKSLDDLTANPFTDLE